MAPALFGASSPPIGLDIGTDHARAALIKPSASGYTLTAYGSVPMPYGSMVEGEIVDVQAVATTLRELWRHAGIRAKDVSVGVSNQKVVVRLVDLPFMGAEELAGAIQYQAQDYIPMPMESAILSHEVIGEFRTSADEHMMEVLLVAAQRDMIDTFVDAVDRAGLRLASVDVSSFAIVRALLGTDASGAFDDEGLATAVVHVASSLTSISVVERGVPRFTRISSLAGGQFTQAIASALDVTYEQAEELKIRVGLPAVDGSAEAVHEGIDADVAQAVHDCLEREVGKFVAEIRRSLDYYLTQTSKVKDIRRILLTGSNAQLLNLAAYLEKGLQTQVLLGDPLAHIDVSAAVRQRVEDDRMGCATAIGLALGGLQA